VVALQTCDDDDDASRDVLAGNQRSLGDGLIPVVVVVDKCAFDGVDGT
jgi:hypothetical protein